MIVSRSIPAPPPEVKLANYLILNYDPLRRSDSVVLIKLLQFQGDDDGEDDSLSVMVEEEIARRKAGGGRLQ